MEQNWILICCLANFIESISWMVRKGLELGTDQPRTRLGIDRSWLQELQCKSHACAKNSTSLPARWDVGDMIDLPTSWSRFFYKREARAVDFLCFLRKKRARERASRWGQLPEPEMRSEGLWQSLKIWQWTRTCLAIFLNFTKSLKRLHKLARSGEYSQYLQWAQTIHIQLHHCKKQKLSQWIFILDFTPILSAFQ